MKLSETFEKDPKKFHSVFYAKDIESLKAVKQSSSGYRETDYDSASSCIFEHIEGEKNANDEPLILFYEKWVQPVGSDEFYELKKGERYGVVYQSGSKLHATNGLPEIHWGWLGSKNEQ